MTISKIGALVFWGMILTTVYLHRLDLMAMAVVSLIVGFMVADNDDEED